MEDVLKFFGSDVGVGIAWCCTVGSALYAFLLKKEITTLKLTINNKTVKSAAVDKSIDNSTKNTNQTAEKLVNTEKNTGDINITM